MTETFTTVRATDGIELAVYHHRPFDPALPTVLAVHGYPDNHRVWGAVADHLEKHPGALGPANFVTYDVRGTGASAAPARRSGYRLSQLASDVALVAHSVDPRGVHLIAHDWGSIQAWEAVTTPQYESAFLSFTSMSGPLLDHSSSFMRSVRGPGSLRAVLRQARCSYYILIFLTPRLPEYLWRGPLGAKILRGFSRRPNPIHRDWRDIINGLELYRANMPHFARSRGRTTAVPVQVLIPNQDIFVKAAVVREAARFIHDIEFIDIVGGHWVLSDAAERFAEPAAAFAGTAQGTPR